MLHPSNWSLWLPYYAAALAFGYLLGSIPFGLVFTRLAGTEDIRQIGSGSIGATNVLRTGRKGLAAATVLCDMLKGTLAVLAMYWWWGRDPSLVAGLGAFLGHLFPVWLRFKGGKGVATHFGIVIALAWQATLGFAVVWLAVAALTRYSSLASLLASAVPPVVFWLMGDRPEAALTFVLAALTIVMHRGNIARLLGGTETKIGQKAAPVDGG